MRVEPEGEFWTDELEELHEETSRTHFLDVWTRDALIGSLGPLKPNAKIFDAGCSSGYLLEDLERCYESPKLIGLDYVMAGLKLARSNLPGAALIRGDACSLPFRDASLDAIFSANLLEHVPNDTGALQEFARVMKPGARASLAVPANPGTYDYYDRFLHHRRRYARHELSKKARSVGLIVIETFHIGFLIYPAFWAVKKKNRALHGGLRDVELKQKVAHDIASTRNSRFGELTCELERTIKRIGFRSPIGIREVVLLERSS